jgi:hypothetical protein
MSVCLNIGVRDGGEGEGQLPPPKRLQSGKVGQMFNISRAKSKEQRTGTNYVNFVLNFLIYGKGV